MIDFYDEMPNRQINPPKGFFQAAFNIYYSEIGFFQA